MILPNFGIESKSFIEWIKIFDYIACQKSALYYMNAKLKHIQENITEEQKQRIKEIHGWK